MESNFILIILSKILPELPALAGEQWAELEAPLQALQRELSSATDPQQQDYICYKIVQLLETVPAFIARFDQEKELFDPSDSLQITRNIFLTQLQNLLGRKRTSQGQLLTRFVDISCPRRVWLQTSRISIVVRLNEYPSRVSDAATEVLQARKEKPVQVTIDAPDFLLLGPGTQQLVLSSSEPESTPLVFDLAPLRVGTGAIHFDFTQDGDHLGSTALPIEITANEVSTQVQGHIETPLSSTGTVPAPDFILYITCRPASSPNELHFRLVSRDQSFEQEFLPHQLKKPLQDHTRTIYSSLTDLMSRIDSTALAVLGSAKPLSKEMIEDRLRTEGMNLWKELVPLELREHYARERAAWANKSLLIISDEPDIPWELLWPYGETWSDPHPLCLQMNLSRWLRSSPYEVTIPPPCQSVSLQRLATIVPIDTHLPSASRERSFLRTFMLQHQLQDVSPPEPTSKNVKQFLREETYDWVHVATHGNFYQADPDRASAIWLLDQQSLTPRDIIGEIAQAIRHQRPAFVFNACEAGHQGWAINGLGGWASRLIGTGAGLFLAPLWPVDDRSAYRFTTAFYQSLLNGKSVGEAVRQARLEARQEGDPSWLAYSLYAHPNASVG